MAESLNISFLGRIPLDPTLSQLMEGTCFTESFATSALLAIFLDIVTKLVK